MLIIAKDVIIHGTHSFDGGFLTDTEEIKEQLLELKGQDGITFSGGDPLFQLEACLDIATFCKNHSLSIWCYTGFTFEELLAFNDINILSFLNIIDVLVDGKFIEEQKDLSLDFRGSSNQRVLDMKKSMKHNKAMLLEEVNIDIIQEYFWKKETLFI